MLTEIVCLADTSTVIPELKMEALTIKMPTNIAAFQGPKDKDKDYVEYKVQGQYFGSDEVVLNYSNIKFNPAEIDKTLSNPYLILLVDDYISEYLDPVSRFLLTSLTCKKQLESMLTEIPDLWARQKVLYTKYQNLGLIITIQQNEKYYVFYELLPKTGERRRILLRVLEPIGGGKYLLGCGELSNPIILNMNTYLLTHSVEDLKSIIIK